MEPSRQDFARKDVEVLGLAEKVRLVGRREIEQVLDLPGLGGLVSEESFVVLCETFQPKLTQPPVQATLQHHLLRGGHLDPKMLRDEGAEIRELLRRQCTGHVRDAHN